MSGTVSTQTLKLPVRLDDINEVHLERVLVAATPMVRVMCGTVVVIIFTLAGAAVLLANIFVG